MTKDVPDYALVLGNPARIAGWMCECGNRIQFQDGLATCDECGKQYEQAKEGCVEPFENQHIIQSQAGRKSGPSLSFHNA